MIKSKINAAVSAFLAGALMIGAACVPAGAAVTSEAAADGEVILNYSTQKQDTYLLFDSTKTTSSGTLTANVGDLIEITVSAKSNDPDYTKFCNGQCSTVFNVDSVDGRLITSENNGILSFYDKYYLDEDEEYIRVNANNKLPSLIINSGTFPNMLFFNFSNDSNIIDLSKETMLYSFVVKAEKPGTVNLVTGDYYIGLNENADDYFDFVNGKADITTSAKVIKDEPTPSPAEYLVGDINSDGKVNGLDSSILARYIASWDNYESKIKNMKAADINGDGNVNGLDSSILSRHMAGWTQYDKYFVTRSL